MKTNKDVLINALATKEAIASVNLDKGNMQTICPVEEVMSLEDLFKNIKCRDYPKCVESLGSSSPCYYCELLEKAWSDIEALAKEIIRKYRKDCQCEYIVKKNLSGICRNCKKIIVIKDFVYGK